MGRHSKMKPPTKRRRKATTTASVPPDIEPMLARTLAHLERLFESSEATFEAGDANPALLRETSGVARAIVSISAEIRAREKAAWQRATEFTVHEVVEFARTLSADERRRLVLAVQDLDAQTGSGLA